MNLKNALEPFDRRRGILISTWPRPQRDYGGYLRPSCTGGDGFLVSVMSDLVTELSRNLDTAPWSLLKLHAQRGGLIWVQPDLDLLQVAVAVAQDQVQLVEEWLRKGAMRKPTLQDFAELDVAPQREFMSVVVQPWVLFQDLKN